MKHVSLDQLVVEFVPDPKPTKKEKLQHWANLVKAEPGYNRLFLFHHLEYFPPMDLHWIFPRQFSRSAMTVAMDNPTFREQGIGTSVKSVMDFFEISQHDLHEFSCDCGGEVTNVEQARRIEYLANQ